MKKYFLLTIFAFYAFSIHCQENRNKMNTERLTYFNFDHHNSMVLYAGEKYEVSTAGDGRVLVVIDEGFPGEKRFYRNDQLDNLQRVANAAQLKIDIYDYHTDDENATRCTYYVRYNTGDTISGYTCHTQFPGRKETAIFDFFSHWQ